jgi:hypothetical protein
MPYPQPEFNRPLDGALPRLTAQVVMINIIADVGPTTITIDEPAQGLVYTGIPQIPIPQRPSCAP